MQSTMLTLLNQSVAAGPAADAMRGPAGDIMRGPGGGMMHGHPGGFFLGGLMGGFFTAVWAAIIVLLVLWIARNWSSPRNPITAFTRRAVSAVQATTSAVSSMQTPLEILQTRYAKGEISREEYETIRHDLAGEAPPIQPPPAEVPPVQA